MPSNSGPLRVLFLRHRSLSSLLLRTALWSAWSHVALLFDDDSVIESRAATGVRRSRLRDVAAAASHYQIATVQARTLPVLDFAEAQLGKPYDWTAVAGIGLHRDWQEPDSWFCSELVAAALKAGGVEVVRKQQWRVTPQDLVESPLLIPVWIS